MRLRIVVDTNVLLRSIQANHPQRDASSESIVEIRKQNHEVFVAPQNYFELWVVCTRPETNNGLGFTVKRTEAELFNFQSFLPMVEETPEAFHTWQELVIKNSVLGKAAHDAHLVAIMKVHAVTHLLTFNTQDFQRYENISVLHPDKVLQSANNPP